VIGTRVSMVVLNAVTHDRRVIREASTLASAGCDVTVFGTTDIAGLLPTEEQHPDGFRIVRVPIPPRPKLWSSRRRDYSDAWTTLRTGPWTAARAARALRSAPWWAAKSTIAAGPYALHVASAGTASWLLNSQSRWRQWRRAVLAAVPASDVFHGHDLTGLGVAVAARKRHGGKVIYDSHDLFIEAGANATRPGPVRRILAEIERHWYRQADLLITVNRGIADELVKRYGPKPLAVVHNCVPAWRPEHRPTIGPLRQTLGLGPSTPIVLYHGGFTANRGLGMLARSMLEPGLEDARLVFLGYGPMEDELRRLAAQPAFDGRVHVIAAVPPSELDRYIADADVAAMVNQPAGLNEILSTPNKLFESIAAGVPIVTSDFPMRREIVMNNEGGPLGAVCDPQKSDSIGSALRSIIRLGPEEKAALRERCRRAAEQRWNWEREASVFVDAYSDLLSTGLLGQRAEPGIARPE
jgi:glycosyltransferase involved in cell wall biosynthesis